MEIQFNLEKKHVLRFLYALIGVAVIIVLALYIDKRSNSVGADKSDILSGSNIVLPTGPEVEQIKSLAESEGVASAYASIKAKYRTNPPAGHDLAHLVGQLAYRKDGAKGLSVCDFELGFGCYHGLFDMLIRDQGDAGLEQAQASCVASGLSGVTASCIHGIGHGVMGYAGKVDPAVEMCGKLEERHELYCFDGVYMEFFSGIMKGEREALIVSEEDPWGYCKARSGSSQSQCVRNATIYYLGTRPNGKATVAGWCGMLDDNLGQHCVLNFGIHMAQIANGSKETVVESCNAFLETKNKNICIANAAREFVFQNRPFTEAESLCASVSSDFATPCIQELEAMKASYGK